MKSHLRKIRNRLFDEPKKLLIKPLKLSNLHGWIYETAKLDLDAYGKLSRPKRSLTPKRLLSLLSPNLKNPVFIVGSPRSGTTFLGSCISVIPELSYHFEPVISKAAVRYVATQQWDVRTARWFYQSVYGWLMRLRLDSDLRFVEKTPRNSFVIPMLHMVFPKAKFIYIMRDGRDASLSLAQKPWYNSGAHYSGMHQPGGYPFGPMARFWVEADRKEEYETTSTLHRCMWVWRRYVETALAAIENLPEGSVHILKYETLAANPRVEADKILDFLEIDMPASRQLFHEAISTVHPDSVGRWKEELSEEQHQLCNREAGSLLLELGYLEPIREPSVLT